MQRKDIMNLKEGKIFEYETTILEHRLDSFGHMNNTQYMALFEEARWDFITKNGYGLEVIQQLKQGPIILDCSIRFKNEVKNRETIVVKSQSIGLRNPLIVKLKQQMIKAGGSLAAEAEFQIGLFDLVERKLVSPRTQWLQAIGYCL